MRSSYGLSVYEVQYAKQSPTRAPHVYFLRQFLAPEASDLREEQQSMVKGHFSGFGRVLTRHL